MYSFTDYTCTTKGNHIINVYDIVSVGSSSGSNYQVSQLQTALKTLVTTTTAETWVESLWADIFDLTVGAEYTHSNTLQSYGLWNLSGTTFQKGLTSTSAYPSSLWTVRHPPSKIPHSRNTNRLMLYIVFS